MSIKNTTELKTGDIIQHYGMVIKLGERKAYKAINIDGSQANDTVVRFSGEILNVEEVNADGVVPFSWRCENNKLGNEWSVQGNHLATWKVLEEVVA